ncbi:MAG: sodium:proton antiporter, partial [Deltaproteobacteria bacterium]|nr:sodium:proton antiporter [Deltaproteobacteria bacterium]
MRWPAVLVALLWAAPAQASGAGGHGAGGDVSALALWSIPFAAILLGIAVLPLVHATKHWWEHNRSKLLVSGTLALVVCGYYLFRDVGFHAEPGIASLATVLHHAVVADYIPFIVLLFSLYTISGGIRLTGDVPAHTATNALILGVGAVLASFVGTTGASMLP